MQRRCRRPDPWSAHPALLPAPHPGLCCENPPEHGASRTRERQNTGLPRTREHGASRTRDVLLRSAFICVQPEHSCVLLRSGPSCVLLRSVICVPAQNTDPAFCQNTAAFSCVLGSCVLLRSAFCCVLDPAFCWVLGLGLELVLSSPAYPHSLAHQTSW